MTATAFATTVDYTIPGQYGKDAGAPGFIANLYSFSLLISGALAFAAIVYGGIKYVFAAGNPSGQGEGKEWVKGALLGLLLLGGAYLILRTINPNIINLKIEGLPSLPASSGGATGGGDLLSCANITTCGGDPQHLCSGSCPHPSTSCQNVPNTNDNYSHKECVSIAATQQSACQFAPAGTCIYDVISPLPSGCPQNLLNLSGYPCNQAPANSQCYTKIQC